MKKGNMKSGILLAMMIILQAVLSNAAYAIPPVPPIGYRWVINQDYSDEFNGTKLNMEKWNDYYPGWRGRSPAMFIPQAISVQNGFLKISSGVLEKPVRDYRLYGGAVTSKKTGAHFGYYEVHAKASKIKMSTTFWLSNGKIPFEETEECLTDFYSQELDIQEAVGGGTRFRKFRTSMNSNTHARYVKCDENKETFFSRGTESVLDSEVSDTFHTYGAWWKNANEVFFYADNRFFDTILFRTDFSDTPFDRPMHVNMVTETYNWQPPPTTDEVTDTSINYALYDWVRAYKLIPVNEEYANDYGSDVFADDVEVSLKQSGNKAYIECIYQLNQDSHVKIKVVKESTGEVEAIVHKTLLAGYGKLSIDNEDLGKMQEFNDIDIATEFN